MNELIGSLGNSEVVPIYSDRGAYGYPRYTHSSGHQYHDVDGRKHLTHTRAQGPGRVPGYCLVSPVELMSCTTYIRRINSSTQAGIALGRRRARVQPVPLAQWEDDPWRRSRSLRDSVGQFCHWLLSI
jgi:hypothetical protein